MKTYVITLSKRFPSGHIRAAEPTFFKERFLSGQECKLCPPKDTHKCYPECNECSMNCIPQKYHTIRANYPLWAKRIAEIERDEACLSIRQWSGEPYRSKQVEIGRLTKYEGMGIQKAELTNDLSECIIGKRYYNYVDIAKNDGLHPADWLDWFKGYDLSQPMAIIHFTPFRY